MPAKDRSKWGPGPWDGEPDEARWTDEATGYECAVLRGPWGAWCGYVQLPADHPLHGISYSDDVPARLQGAAEAVMEGEVGKRGPMNVFSMALGGKARSGDLFNVHGSITYSGADWPGAGYWYGFDCSHCDDLAPGSDDSGYAETFGKQYRTFEYVQGECRALARQLQGLVVPFPA